MLIRYDDLEFQLSLGEVEQFQALVTLLLSCGFFFPNSERELKNYRFILKHRQLFDRHFQLSGFTFSIADNIQVVSLENHFRNSRLRKFETCILLLLRLIYCEEEAGNPLSSIQTTTLQTVNKRLEALSMKIKKSDIENALAKFKQINLIEFRSSDKNPDIVLLPTLTVFVNLSKLEISDRLNTLTGSGGEDEDNQTEVD